MALLLPPRFGSDSCTWGPTVGAQFGSRLLSVVFSASSRRSAWYQHIPSALSERSRIWGQSPFRSRTRRMLTIISRPDPRDWHALPYAPRDFTVGLVQGVAGLKIAFSPTLGYASVNDEVAALVKAAVSRFVDVGALVELEEPGFVDPSETFRDHWYTGAANLRRNITADRRKLLEPGFAAIADLGEQIPHMQYIAATDARAAMGHRMNQFHQKFDLLLTPMIPITAFEVGQIAPAGTDQSNWMNWTPFTFPFNLTQQPAASIPCGFTSSGLPVALQIVAAKYRDDLVLRAARAYEVLDPIKTPNLPD